ncbi:MAG: (d)CMP kinase [bacterium]
MKKLIIAIDGPAGSGKSIIAKKLALKLKYMYLDTGAMYRAITLKAISENINLEDVASLIKLSIKSNIEFKMENNELKVFLNEKDVTYEIRSQEITKNAFYIAQVKEIRDILVNQQQKIGKLGGVVAEGRDITTVVFPQAEIKIYLDASLEERTQRRFKDFFARGEKVNIEKLKEEIKIRDERDKIRKDGPLKIAKDAIVIDTTNMSIDEVVEKIYEIAMEIK